MTTPAEALDIGWRRQQAGDLRGAESIYRQVLQVVPKDPNAWCFLGIALHDQQRYEEAVAAYQEALRLKPHFPITLSNLGNTLKALGRFDEAIASCRESIRQKPDYVAAYNNLGVTFVTQGRLEEGVNEFAKAVSLNPNNSVSHANLGAAYCRINRLAEGEQHSREAVRLDPNNAEAHKTLGIVALANGDFATGWAEYEWRWKCPAQKLPRLPQPRWDGSQVQGQTILLYYEQGLGDTIHMVRYAPLIRGMGGRVAVLCQKGLVPLLSTCNGIDELLPDVGLLPAFQCFVPMMSIPSILRTTVATIPAQAPYLQADPALEIKWRERLKTHSEFKIGIAWQGDRNHHSDCQRSIPLAEFEKVAKVPGVKLFSLQKGYGSEQVAACRLRFEITEFGDELDRDGGAFMDTAAILKNMDLVISSDTSLVHVAGALGVPTWLALCIAPDWRWMLDREDSPWYPSLRLFRQTQLNDWAGVFARMAAELAVQIKRG